MPPKQQRSEKVRVVHVQDPWVAYATLPLRFFLGVTFIYAGLQKVFDPGFLKPGAATYIGAQLQAFDLHSPIGFLIESIALPAPALTGIGVIAAEIAIGLATVLGIATRLAAAAGAMVNFVLFLTASWTIQPYFLGSDGIFTVAWITLAIVGDQGVWTAGPYLARQLGVAGGGSGRSAAFDPGRRRMLVGIGAGAVGIVWALSVLPRTLRLGSQSVATPSAGATPSPAATPTAGATPSGTRIGTVSSIQSQGSLSFQDPASGDPALAVQLSNGDVVAFDAICTHAGCQVSYDTQGKLFVCPCHGAEFDPAKSAAVVAGPAPTPLPSIKVAVTSDGSVYVQD